MKKIFLIFKISFLTCFGSFSQQTDAGKIKSIAFEKFDENIQSNFYVGELFQSFSISFDVLNGYESDIYYTIDHCNYDWRKSKLLKSEYLQGFDDVKIDTYYSSFNTYQIYTHYKLNIPNNDLRITKSGNYVITFFDEYGEELFQRKFILFENLSSVGIEIKRSRDLQFINEKQIVNFEINPRLSYFNRPEKNVKVLIFKNDNLKDSIMGVKPMYNRGKNLVYKYDKELSFWGGNEYLYFDNKNIRNTSVRIRSYDLIDIYSNFLYTDISRIGKKYTYNPDINGNFVINNISSNEDYIEADYANIYFSLNPNNKFSNSAMDVYVVGSFNDYELKDENKMTFDNLRNKFELKLKLKQGFYNYKYIVADKSKKIIKNLNVGGNFDETENKYSVVVYYRENGGRYDKVVGYSNASSQFITN